MFLGGRAGQGRYESILAPRCADTRVTGQGRGRTCRSVPVGSTKKIAVAGAGERGSPHGGLSGVVVVMHEGSTYPYVILAGEVLHNR